jgi:hypothetical protein
VPSLQKLAVYSAEALEELEAAILPKAVVRKPKAAKTEAAAPGRGAAAAAKKKAPARRPRTSAAA